MEKKMKKILSLLFVLLYLSAWMAEAQNSGRILLYKPDERLSLNRLVKDLIEVMKIDPEFSDASFIIDGSLDQEINIDLKNTSVSPEQARELLEGILENYNYTVVYQRKYLDQKLKKGKKEKIVRIMQSGTAVQKGFASLSDEPGGEPFATHLFKLSHIRSKDISGILTSLSAGVKLLEFGNYILVTDYRTNLERIRMILDKIDVEKNRLDIYTLSLNYITAKDMESKLSKAYQKVLGDQFMVLSEPASNSITVLADKEHFESIRNFIQKMDRDQYYSMNHFRIFLLKYGTADEIKKYIEKVLNIDEASSSYYLTLIPDLRMNAIIAASSSEKIINTIEGLINQIDKPSSSDSNGVIIHPLKNANVKDIVPVLEKLFPELKVADKNASSADYVSIVGDERTNTLLITAPHPKRTQFERVINQLDSFPPQVMVEVLIVELSIRKSRTLGVEWGLFDKKRTDERGFVTSQTGLKNNILSSQGMNVGLYNGTVDLEKLSKNDVNELTKIEALMALYQNDSDFDILSAPKIYVLDRKEAKIVVGEEIATPQGVIRSLDTGNTDVTNFEYKNIGINLTIIPVINDQKHVTMEIKQTITKRQEETLYDFQIPVFTKREASTHITIKDSETIVLAGMVSEDKTRIVDKTPYLGDIPVIGGLFKKTRDVSRKTDLHIFITPHIVFHPEQRNRFSRKVSGDTMNLDYHRPSSEARFQNTVKKVNTAMRNEGTIRNGI